jgi:hypothetical protein
MNTPDDLSLPFFAYGLLKPGQPAFVQIRDYVAVAGCVTARAPGDLLIQDGLPILKKTDNKTTEGVLVTFKDKLSARKAYKTISAFEPAAIYEWDTVVVANQRANVLYAAHPEAGNPIDWPDWDGWDGALFEVALQVVEETRQQASRSRNYHRLFRLQMAYLLLWSAIERYVTFRYRAGDWIEKLSAEKGFAKLVEQHVPKAIGQPPRVVNVRDPGGEVFRLDPSQPSECLRFYRQVRHNVTHRGKSGPGRDEKLLEDSLAQLVPIFEGIRKNAREEADSDCHRFLNPQPG